MDLEKRNAITRGIIRFIISDRREAFAIRDGLENFENPQSLLTNTSQRVNALIAIGVAMNVSQWLRLEDISDFIWCCGKALDAYLLGLTDYWLNSEE